jgi:hypothetical protein
MKDNKELEPILKAIISILSRMDRDSSTYWKDSRELEILKLEFEKLYNKDN